MKRLLGLVALAAALSFVAASAAAEPPANDNQAAAPLLTLPAALDGTTVGSTTEKADPECAADMSGTVWYSLARGDDLTIAVGFQARGELDAVVGAFQVVKGGLKTLVCVTSDSHGKAGFSFTGEKGGKYLILVGQRSNSVAGTFHLTVQSPPRPSNDDRAGARLLPKLPAAPTGTTLGASTDPQTPQCGRLAADVWYRFDRRTAGMVVVSLRAHGDLDGTLAVYRQVRSQLQRLVCMGTDSKGKADVTFGTEKGGRYLIAVGQLAGSAPGPFGLQVFAPEAPAVGPGQTLVHGQAHATVDALTDTDDAYAVSMEAGRTYRVNLVGRNTCVSLELYPPGTRSFADAESLENWYCGGYHLFTPGPDGGGIYTLRVVAEEEDVRGAQPYSLHFAAAGPDDIGPGVLLRNGTTVAGTLDGRGIDVVDLYRFDVARRSEVDLRLSLSKQASASLLSEDGRRIGARRLHDRLRVQLNAGRYFVTLRAEPVRARYRVGLLIREITKTDISVNGKKKLVLATPQPVTLTAMVQPEAANGGVVRIQVNYFDPLQGWVFVRWYTPRVKGTEASVSFTPTRVGRYRVRASYFGNHAASPSESGPPAVLVVGPPVAAGT